MRVFFELFWSGSRQGAWSFEPGHDILIGSAEGQLPLHGFPPMPHDFVFARADADTTVVHLPPGVLAVKSRRGDNRQPIYGATATFTVGDELELSHRQLTLRVFRANRNQGSPESWKGRAGLLALGAVLVLTAAAIISVITRTTPVDEKARLLHGPAK